MPAPCPGEMARCVSVSYIYMYTCTCTCILVCTHTTVLTLIIWLLEQHILYNICTILNSTNERVECLRLRSNRIATNSTERVNAEFLDPFSYPRLSYIVCTDKAGHYSLGVFHDNSVRVLDTLHFSISRRHQSFVSTHWSQTAIISIVQVLSNQCQMPKDKNNHFDGSNN